MAEGYRSFGSYILFKEKLNDALGHLYRAGHFDAGGVRRTVLFRIFDKPGLPTDDIIKSFDSAKKIGRLLQATNVASGTDFVVEDGVPAMACDFVPGQPLSYLFEKVDSEGFPIAVDNALLIMEKISLGLASGLVLDIGGQPMVHGMLHPALVMVSNDGEGIVTGFGIAEQLLSILDSPEADKIAPYLAPEVLISRTPNKRSDVYSLGAILFQLLTGSPLPADPAEREGILDRAEISFEGDPIPDDIKALLGRCLATNMENRHSSAADFKKELDKLLYGGNYSPTTFNLALFMDRLFRDEIETTEKERAKEAKIDVEPYLKPEPEVAEVEEVTTPAKGKSLYLMIAAALVLVAVVLVMFMKGGIGGPAAVPTPTPEEIAAQKAAQEQRIMELAAQIADEKMKEMESNISSELEQRQAKIDELQKQLSKDKPGQGNSAAEAKRKAAIQRQIEAEKEQQRQRQEELRKEKERLLEQSRIEAENRAKKEAAEAEARAAADREASLQTQTPPEEASNPTPANAPPTAAPQTTSPTVETVKENQFVQATELDSAPAVLKEEPVDWPRAARKIRHKKGMVIVQATVNSKGQVEDVKILRADEEGGGIPEAVIRAVKKYTFKPGMKNGVKVKTTATVVKRYSFR